MFKPKVSTETKKSLEVIIENAKNVVKFEDVFTEEDEEEQK